MNIKINKKYWIEGKKGVFTICYMTGNEGKEQKKVLGYYTELSGLFKSLVKVMVCDEDITSLDQLSAALNSIHELLDEKLKGI